MKFLKYITNAVAFSLICLLAAGVLSSCDKDDDVDTDRVELFSFGPAGVKHGEMVKFIGSNLDQVTSVVFEGAEVSKSEFSSQRSELIELVVPAAALEGKVTLKTPGGDVVSKTRISFEVPVKITSVPAEVKPGTDLVITGEFLKWVQTIQFNDGIEVTEFEVNDAQTQLTVTVPMEAQTGYLLFSSGGTEPLEFSSEEELIVTLPAIASLSPTSIKHTSDLTITGTDLDLVTEVVFNGDFTVSEFVSQTETELVVTVPVGALKGTITLNVHSPVQVISEDEITIILPAGTSVSPQPAVPGIDNITIAGTNLDLVAELSLPGIEDPISNFVSQSATEIVVNVPEGAKNGGIKYTTIHGYSELLGVNLIVPGEGPPPLAITLYDDAFFYGGQDWSWGASSTDPASSEKFYSGEVSFKHVQAGGDGGLKVGNMSGVDASEMKVFAFSLYGGPGTNGKQVACILGSDGGDKWDSYNSVTLVEGEWTDYELDLALYPTVNLENINIFIFKMEGSSGGEILYADRVGFDMGGPEALSVEIYDDEAQIGVGGGWGSATFDVASTEVVRVGSKSVKATYGGDWGGACQFGTWGSDPLSTGGAAYFVFSIYGGEGTGGLNIQINMKDDGGGEQSVQVAIEEGAWKDVAVPLSDLGNPAALTEVSFQDTGWSGTVHIDYIGFR